MGDWHSCDTTHCWAGWIVHLAGEEGYKLEKQTSCAFAAYQIAKKSSENKVRFPWFYKSNNDALKKMKELANLEARKQPDTED